MAYELDGKLSLKLLFNDEEFVFERSNSLDFLHAVCSTKIGIPMLHLVLQDNLDILSESKNLNDSSLIQAVVQSRQDDFSTQYKFRVNGYNRKPSDGGYKYEIDAYLDAPQYWHASSNTPKRGTSYSVLKDISQECGLDFSGDQTIDSQLWFPRNIPFHEWARQISERGYRNDTSFMQLGLNFDKTLSYHDLSLDQPVKAKFAFAEFKEGFYTLYDVQPSAQNGSLNHFSGYAASHIEQDLHSSDLYKVNSQVQINKKSGEGKMVLNSKVKDSVKQARVTFAPIDVGNVHPDYEKALYQNRRINNMYGVRLDVVTPSATRLHLLDKVSVSLDNAEGYLKTYSGDYFVVSRTVFIKGSEYFEKLELVRKTLNVNLKDSVG